MRNYLSLSRSFAVASAAVLAIALSGCSDDDTTTPSKAGTFVGETVTLGPEKISSWLKLDDNGNPASLGVTFSEGVLDSMPDAVMGPFYHLALPSQASATPYNHISLDWNAHGHDPMPIYGLPHFDLHFYTIDTNARKAIAGGPDFTPVEARYIPTDYGTGSDTAFAVPQMGVHYVDLTSHEFHGYDFDYTFIYGFSNGNLVFQEPMFTEAFLRKKENITVNIKQPAAYQRTGLYYPTKYSITYDAAKKEYNFVLEGMVKK